MQTERAAPFTVRIDPEQRAKAQSLADFAKWSLGTWVNTAIEEKIERDLKSVNPNCRSEKPNEH